MIRLGLIALCLMACDGDDSSLDGSVSEFYPLRFERVRARLYSSELAIEFVRATGETIVRVTVRRDERDPSGPGRIDLGTVGDITGSADGAELPPFVGGSLVLADYRPKDHALVAGSFDARLTSGDTTLTITGTFEARLDVVEDL